MQLMDKVVLVTGSTRGIGLATAHAFAQAGAKVILHGRKQPSDKLLAEFANYQHQPVVCLGDLTDEKALKQLVTDVATVGPVDILINNAGITDDSLAMGMKTEQFMRVVQTNLVATFNLTQPIFKQMLKKRTGSIINLSSVVGISGNVGQVNYAASKAGIIGLTKTLAKEGAMRGIRVNAIAPGMIATDMTAALSDKVQAEILEQIPLKRFGEANEIAQTAIFLAQNDYITGQTIVVDGGMIG